MRSLSSNRNRGLDDIDFIDWSRYDFRKLEDCRKALGHCDNNNNNNNNGAMVIIVKERQDEYAYPNFRLGFLFGPEGLKGDSAYSRWVTMEEFMRHQPRYEEQYDDVFAHSFDALTTLSGTMHLARTTSS